MKSFSIYNEWELVNIVQEIRNEFPDARIFLLEGDLGAGKTTFVKYFVHSFQKDYEVQSPTFTIANVYSLNNLNLSILHADLYRLKSHEEVIESGIPELLFHCDYAFIEWYGLILPWIDKALIIRIEMKENIRKFFIDEWNM